MTRGILLRSDREVDVDGHDVTVHAPTPDLRAQALVTDPKTHGLLISRDEPSVEVACFICKGRSDAPVAVRVEWPRSQGHPLTLCRACILMRPVNNPIVIDISASE